MLAITKLSAQNKIIIDLNTSKQSTNKYSQNETEIKSIVYNAVGKKSTIINTTSYTYTGIDYSANNLEFLVGPIKFNSIQNDLSLIHKLTRKMNVNVSINPVATFEQNLSISNIALLAQVGISYKFNKSSQLNIGALRGMTFGEIQILPTLTFLYKLNEELNMELGFPYTSLSFSNNIRNTLKLTNNFAGTSYNLESETSYNIPTTAHYSSMTTSFEYERNVDSNWFLNFKGGYEFAKKFNYKYENQKTFYDFKMKDAYSFTIGLKYKY
jgi:hypothetical protein